MHEQMKMRVSLNLKASAILALLLPFVLFQGFAEGRAIDENLDKLGSKRFIVASQATRRDELRESKFLPFLALAGYGVITGGLAIKELVVNIKRRQDYKARQRMNHESEG